MALEPIIGLEIHVQLKTKRKMFCDCPNVPDATPPNTAVCPICLGHPGTLPMPNKKAIEWSAKAALALNCTVRHDSKFDRKHYFYPDLPKGYQISQYNKPIGEGGFLKIADGNVRINRLHLEEDAAKLIHDEKIVSIDFNRAGTPLMEIVTEADLRDPREAKEFLQELREIIRSLGVSDADMEKGQLRCDVNISLREKGKRKLNPKTEIKNVNSFRAVQRALEFEINRQTKLWNEENPPHKQTTRGWDDEKGATIEQRIKEEAADYRYFPEPDIPPLMLSDEWIKNRAREIGELPEAARARFIKEYDVAPADAKLLVENRALADYAEHVFSELAEWQSTLADADDRAQKKTASLVSGWLINKYPSVLRALERTIDSARTTPENFAEFLTLVGMRRVNTTNALTLLARMEETGHDPTHILEEESLAQDIEGETLIKAIQNALSEHPDVVESIKRGKKTAVQFLVGAVMRETKGKANPEDVRQLLLEKLQL